MNDQFLNQTDKTNEELKKWINLYRTMWLLSHNCVHDLAFGLKPEKERFEVLPEFEERWEKYFADLKKSDELARMPA